MARQRRRDSRVVVGWCGGICGDARRSVPRSLPVEPVVFDLVVTEVSDEAVEWHIAESPPWWRGTTIRFQLTPAEVGTTMLFTHGGFEPGDPIIEAITPAWVRFLDNLVAVARSGVANPAVVN